MNNGFEFFTIEGFNQSTSETPVKVSTALLIGCGLCFVDSILHLISRGLWHYIPLPVHALSVEILAHIQSTVPCATSISLDAQLSFIDQSQWAFVVSICSLLVEKATFRFDHILYTAFAVIHSWLSYLSCLYHFWFIRPYNIFLCAFCSKTLYPQLFPQ